MMGVGAILRDHLGENMVVISKFIDGDYDVTTAKAIALSQPVTIVIEVGFSSFPSLSLTLLLLFVSLMKDTLLDLLTVISLILIEGLLIF